MSEQILRELDEKMKKTLEYLEMELSTIRANRAHPSLIEDVKVEAYESKLPLKQLATVTAPEPTLLVIQPWDKSLVKAIEKGISLSGQGLSAVVEGDILRVPLPQLSSDRRSELAKLAQDKGESAKIALRNVRHEVLEELEKDEVSEDEEERFKKQIDDKVQKARDLISERIEKKVSEIVTL